MSVTDGLPSTPVASFSVSTPVTAALPLQCCPGFALQLPTPPRFVSPSTGTKSKLTQTQSGWGGQEPLEIIWSTPCSSRATQSQLPSTISRPLLSISKDGDSTGSPSEIKAFEIDNVSVKKGMSFDSEDLLASHR